MTCLCGCVTMGRAAWGRVVTLCRSRLSPVLRGTPAAWLRRGASRHLRAAATGLAVETLGALPSATSQTHARHVAWDPPQELRLFLETPGDLASSIQWSGLAPPAASVLEGTAKFSMQLIGRESKVGPRAAAGRGGGPAAGVCCRGWFGSGGQGVQPGASPQPRTRLAWSRWSAWQGQPAAPGS
jgi:hypothetical protein